MSRRKKARNRCPEPVPAAEQAVARRKLPEPNPPRPNPPRPNLPLLLLAGLSLAAWITFLVVLAVAI